MNVDLIRLRREFTSNGISSADLDSNPFVQFKIWMEQALDSELTLPNAMSLATSDESGVGIRTVLLKTFDEQGFVFFTNYNSKKSKQINNNPTVALLFPWLDLERQVKISGTVEKIPTLESIKYFASRPKDSQLGAWASEQSSILNSRQVLLSEFDVMKRKFGEGEVPLPDFWGGYRVVPATIEFWQGRENRLHDRLVYVRKDSAWEISRLAP
ncbi:pyridoxamine 5'-phosphate oxidase [bacterium endosymbiont of Bathymodiolus sp. 5 South]|jgi:pyridoxamine 5'-phosphate oxidase|uniref:pyridoxamine 5'-phosphate oxidase n=1 Tax=bacterium endosymbiont of Bathymodiolus sp. 5 South TaxID=1181670 RepID=UPI0010B1B56D|nr:pyridoxamine 5'-phosphate oxidase [bacterium endosymbiont of Bathymodiolus sp. 5 South]CAC9433445.1 Pyridoxamine 5'-phosphate oxidase (EC 1.4.3.5) [uncultured Gammaproteobacteria bacterium]CAC9642514.1 Pyridoxamine 5'-phosphate oxidase (EC 1.4.3.5) [uncultured Gammaproteobacteria bacterium]CAC9647154.1 Pyridoxamine 5'-phosphate oxidase (EC 1.4.3.5) [uncultured Gammaproteobacteria bacterium]SHN89401.1 Pyridoxamine 5'-phosphate oxidase [bacterium endosymbiont of Bathymodiolus sp. 5 South]SSC0